MDKTVAIFAKNSREQVRVSLSEYRGHQLLNLWVFWTPDKGTTWHPSKKGLAISVEKLPMLLGSLHQATEFLGQDEPEVAEEDGAFLTVEERAVLCEELNVTTEEIDGLLSEGCAPNSRTGVT